eukprot:4197889-Pyramimonas_sp.AAC.1
MLAADPADRPTIQRLLQHPLWWTPEELMAQAKILYDRRYGATTKTYGVRKEFAGELKFRVMRC